MKFKEGFMICTGQPKNDFLDVSVRHVFFKQGIMGVKVKIMLPYDPQGKFGGVKHPLPDTVEIEEPKVFDDAEIRSTQVEDYGDEGGEGDDGQGPEDDQGET